MEQQRIHTVIRSKTLVVLIPLSIFSFLLYYYTTSNLLPSFLQPIRFSNTPFVRSLDKILMSRKACMFLLCNSILLFLLTEFRLLSSSNSSNDFYDEYRLRTDERLPPGLNHVQVQVIDVEDEKVVKDRRYRELFVQRAVVEGDVGVALEVVVEGVGEEMEDLGVEEEDELEVLGVEEDDELELLGTEELNRRIEEFIEREKRKRRLEALQLVMG